jgi:hypothetical protein
LHFYLLCSQVENRKHEEDLSYLKLPPTKAMIEPGGSERTKVVSGPYTQSLKDMLSISTFVCSTKLTHNGG